MCDLLEQRLEAVRRRLQGERPIDICRDMEKPRSWFFDWWGRYQKLGPEGLKDLPKTPQVVANKTDKVIEVAVVNIRKRLERRDEEEIKYMLIGAPSITREMQQLGYTTIPHLRTINRILQRYELTKPKAKSLVEWTTKDYPAPIVLEPNDVQQLDMVGPRYLKGQSTKYYFCALKDIMGKAVFVDAFDNRKSDSVVGFLISGFKELGIPKVLQIDNGTEFLGSPRYPKSLSKPIKLCLHLGIEVLFIPPKSPWRNGCIESFNGLLDELLVKTQELSNLAQMKQEARAFTQACNTKHPHPALGYQTAMEYRQQHPIILLQNYFELPPKNQPVEDGKISFIRMVRNSGRISILYEKFDIDENLKWEYVYATIFVKERKLSLYSTPVEILLKMACF